MRLFIAFLAVLVSTAPLGTAGEVARYVRFTDGETARLGLLRGDTIHVLAGSLFGVHRATGETRPLGAVRLLPPVVPGKVLAVERDDHGGADGAGAARPQLVAKLPSSVIGPEDPIPYPPDASDLHVEGELVVVIGKRTRDVSVEDAPEHVLGVTAGTDVSERSWQAGDLQWLRAKGSDGFGPIGPVLVRGLDWRNLTIETRLNGAVVQRGSTAGLSHSVAEIVSFASRYVTLEPGDIVFTGAPGGSIAVRKGDVVEIEIEGVGALRNPVAAALSARAPAESELPSAAPRAGKHRGTGRAERQSEGLSFLWAAAAALGVGAIALLFVLVSISPARISRAVHQLRRQSAESGRDERAEPRDST